jgi:hypothetical protein
MTILIFIGCKAQGNLQRNGRVTPALRRRRQKIHFVALSFHFIGLVAVLQGPLEKSIVVPSVIVTDITVRAPAE